MSSTLFRLFGEIAVRNEEANNAIDETTGKASSAKKRLNTTLASIGKAAVGIGKFGATAITLVGGAMFNLAENTRDYRTEMGKLDTAFVTSGHSSDAAKRTYKALQSVLGETDQAVEAANHIAKLTQNEQDLQTWTDVCTGVFATFGDSLPIEGLTESANETAKVGTVTGQLADALNWAGINEKAFNEKLAACTSEQQRQDLILNTLNSTYAAAAEQYKKTNAEVMDANAAHDNLNAAMAKLGEAAEPAVTLVINAVAMLAEMATPVIEGITTVVFALRDAAVALGEAWSNLKTKMTNISANVSVTYDNIGAAVTNATGSSFLGQLAQINAQNFSVNPDAPWLPSWHAEGAIFSKPTLFNTRLGLHGVGEAGPEAVAPIEKLQQYVSDAVNGAISGLQLNVVMDTGAVVGQLVHGMDRELGTIAGRKGRG